MKKILLNSTLIACLGVGAISLWYVANPVTVFAAESWADCLDGSTVHCSAPNSTCIAVDETESRSGYCRCTSNEPGNPETDHENCPSDDPPILD